MYIMSELCMFLLLLCCQVSVGLNRGKYNFIPVNFLARYRDEMLIRYLQHKRCNLYSPGTKSIMSNFTYSSRLLVPSSPIPSILVGCSVKTQAFRSCNSHADVLWIRNSYTIKIICLYMQVSSRWVVFLHCKAFRT